MRVAFFLQLSARAEKKAAGSSPRLFSENNKTNRRRAQINGGFVTFLSQQRGFGTLIHTSGL